MATDRAAVLSVLAAAALLLWPALWNGYPIVFADTGTYLSQALHFYAGWDRPVFYSLFMLPLHEAVTTWPVVAVQAVLTAWLVRLVCRVLVPGFSALAFMAGIAGLSLCTWLPWMVCELMPDVFTPLLVLVLCVLALAPERVSTSERGALVVLAAFMIASQQSNLPLSCVPLAVLALARRFRFGPCLHFGSALEVCLCSHRDGRMCCGTPDLIRGYDHERELPQVYRHAADRPARHPPEPVSPGLSGHEDKPTRERWKLPGQVVALYAAARRTRARACKGGSETAVTAASPASAAPAAATRRLWRLILLPPVLAIVGLCTVNLGAHGRFTISPFGNVFLLARVIYDGPGMTVLRRDCPASGWRLCPFLDRFPPRSDDFLWTPDSPLNLGGGPKAVSRDANAIIAKAVAADISGIARSAVSNMMEQLRHFDSGDGLAPWPDQVTPWIERDFPTAEQSAYASALQQQDRLKMPPSLALLHRVAALGGVAACVLLLPMAIRRRAPCLGFLIAALIALPLSAAITGGLSTPHDRYQSRIMWLPPFVAVVSLAALRRRLG